ncbi:PQQ-binding-like beta-propeller repeat protein [Streptomyces sp. NPDC059385]|uniref:serine/threonine-protein kinase n=1 Tax=Streptomyces sp. NPDC059385 TaxID=3346817 RepID=UPI00368548D4
MASSRVLAGRYELVRFVGKGGMGEVWEARDRTLQRRVAVKLLPHQQSDAAGTALFFREARTAGALRHPGVVTIHDLGQDTTDGSLFLVMELLHGRDLSAVLREDGVPAVETALEWTAQAAAALAAAHDAGIVHRDLKPANLMLTTDDRLVILDFGIARFVGATHKSSKIMGTLAYMAPERFRGESGDARSDLYALGCVLNELLTGRAPFEADGPVAMMKAHLDTPPARPSTSRTGVSAALDGLVMALLAKDPRDRPAGAGEVLRRLREPATRGRSGSGRGDRGAERTADLPTGTATGDVPGTGPGGGGSREPGRPDTGDSGPDRDGTGRRPGIARRRLVRVAAAGVVATAAGLAVPAVPALLARWVRWPLHGDSAYSGDPVAARGVVYTGRSDGVLLALDAATGKEKWSLKLGRRPMGLAVADTVVYAANDDGSLYAVDASTGSTRWNYVSGNSFLSPPVAADGTVFLGGRGGLHAIDAATGARRWTYDAGSECSPAVAEGVVYVAASVLTPDSTIHAIDAATGAVKWTLAVDAITQAAPAVAGGVVYIGDWNGRLYALDSATGAKKWVTTVDHEYFASATVTDGLVYVGGTAALYAFDTATGARKWAYPASSPYGASTPVKVDGVVLTALKNTLHAVDALSGVKRWMVGIDEKAHFSQPTVTNSVVCAGGVTDRTLYAFHAASGERL